MNWINAFEILCYAITALLLCDMIRKKDWVQPIFWAAMYGYCLASLWSLGILQAVPWYGLFAVILLVGTLLLCIVKEKEKEYAWNNEFDSI